MSNPQRISPTEARQHTEQGEALLVCAYDSQEKFEQNRLGGAISRDELKNRQSQLSGDQELIFYCA